MIFVLLEKSTFYTIHGTCVRKIIKKEYSQCKQKQNFHTVGILLKKVLKIAK